MQGHKGSLSALPENLSFDHGSTSSEPSIDSQMSWNNRLPEYRILPNETNIQYLHPVDHDGLNSEWSLGETSSTSTHSQGETNERKREHTWNSVHSRGALTLDEPRYEISNILSSENIGVNANNSNSADGSSLNERPNMYISIEASNVPMPSIGDSLDLPSGSGGYVMEEGGDGPGCSLDGRRISCKRKALEVHVGQSSGAGSNISTSTPAENVPIINNGSEQTNPRLRVGAGGPTSENPYSSAARGATENSRRNFRLRINGSRQQDRIPSNPFLPEPEPVNSDIPSSQHSFLHNHFFDLNPPPTVENGSIHGLHVPSMRRNTHSRWSGSTSSRTNTSSDPMLYEESASRNIPRSMSEHPMFVSANEMGSSSQQPTNWNMAGNNIASTSRVGSASGMINSSWSNRSRPPQYSRRLSEIVRRSLLSSTGIESSQGVRSSSSQGMPISLGNGNLGRHVSNLRSALSERQHIDGAFGLPYTLRSLAASGEGRSGITSEQIRHVLDLMRRGEGLRFEDVMILDHSLFFGMADVHDRHRDMRLDVDNMSYEELLALEERIGNVCTGLNEEIIMSRLKQKQYINKGAKNQAETEPCSICREEYNDGEDLGTLECGHDFHRDCIKQWLMHKNLCPICKTTGLTTT